MEFQEATGKRGFRPHPTEGRRAGTSKSPPDTSRAHRPLAATALYEQVADLLRQRILARDLEPGSWIDELKLCGELGISRTPLREALKVLAAEGLVTMKLRRGAYVTEMSERDVPEYVTVDGFKASYVRVPTLDEVPYPVKMEPNLVVEFYSR